MGKKEKSYYWKCPACKMENKVRSAYFSSTGKSSEICSGCLRRVNCYHPMMAHKIIEPNPFEIVHGEILTYSKEE